MNSLIISKVEPKQFYRKLEVLFADLGMPGSVRMFAARFAREFCKHFGEQLSIQSIIAIDTLNDEPEVLYQWGAKDHPLGDEFISRIRNSELPWVGEWNGCVAALFSIGDNPEVLISVLLESAGSPDNSAFCSHIYSLVSSLHYALGQYLRRAELQDAVDQARAIQMSLLPPGDLKFGPFEIAAATMPAHSVGGDVFDFQALDTENLSIALGDAAGHGLPAALQARDVIVGLRMGLELEQDISKVAGKLNRVIHRSGLASRFASLFFASLNSSGNLNYVNAGHPRPLLLDSDGFHELSVSSMILGPNPDTVYTASTVFLNPGSMLALYTDGLLEHSNVHGVEFGTFGLKRWMRDWQHQDASQAMNDLYNRLDLFAQNRPLRDDASAILISHRQ